MAEPVIVPPTPEVYVPSRPDAQDSSPGIEQVQKAFDRAYPDKTKAQSRSETAAPPESPKPVPEPVQEEPPVRETPPPEQEPAEPPQEGKIPSFLEEALKVESKARPEAPKQPEPEPAVEEWPEELPQAEKQSRIKGLREAYRQLKGEVETLRSRPVQDEATIARLQEVQAQNQQMSEVLSRMGVETHEEFQQQVVKPMTAEWYEAARIVKEAGGDPQALAKALSIGGRAQYEALDEIFVDMPESARMEAQQHIANYRRLDAVRQNALKNAPVVAQELRKKDLAKQYEVFNQQRQEQKNLFERALKTLREEAKVEILLKSDSKDSKWWNEQADQVVNNARELYLENTDMGKMAMASLLAPMADVYRKLWLTERASHEKTRKTLDSRYDGEPSMSESAGAGRTPSSRAAADLKRPFSDVFLEEFHRQRSINRR